MQRIYLFLGLFSAAAFAHGQAYDSAVCEASCYYRDARGAFYRETLASTGKSQGATWKSLDARCQKLAVKGQRAELQIANPKFDNNSSAEPEFFAATPALACSPLLRIASAFKRAEAVSPASAEQALQLGNYRVTYVSARKVSPTQTIAQRVQIFQNDKRLYEIDEAAARVLLEKYGDEIHVILAGAKHGSVLSKQVITLNGIKSHCHDVEAASARAELRSYLRSLRCVK